MELLNYYLAKFEVIRTLADDQRGVTALEYGIIASLISVAMIALVRLIGPQVNAMFQVVNTALTAP